MSGRGKGGKGLGKGGAKRHRKVLRDNIQGMFTNRISSFQHDFLINSFHRYHKTSYSSSCSTRWCQTYFWIDLRRSSWCPQNLSWKRHSWCCYIHRTRQAKNCYSYGCCLRTQTTRSYTLRFRFISGLSTAWPDEMKNITLKIKNWKNKNTKTQQPSLGLNLPSLLNSNIWYRVETSNPRKNDRQTDSRRSLEIKKNKQNRMNLFQLERNDMQTVIMSRKMQSVKCWNLFESEDCYCLIIEWNVSRVISIIWIYISFVVHVI